MGQVPDAGQAREASCILRTCPCRASCWSLNSYTWIPVPRAYQPEQAVRVEDKVVGGGVAIADDGVHAPRLEVAGDDLLHAKSWAQSKACCNLSKCIRRGRAVCHHACVLEHCRPAIMAQLSTLMLAVDFAQQQL